MTVRLGTTATVIFIVVVGFAIGAWLAVRTHPVEQAQRVTVASSVSSPRSVPTLAHRTVRILTPAPTPAVLATAATIATAAPTAEPATTASVVSTVAPSTAPATAAADSALQGTWQLDEANVQVGTISWVGDAVPASGNTIVFNVHKQSVGGRRAMPCERQTGLHAAFSLAVAEQTVPYREVNCDGVVSMGEVRVTSFSRTGASFSGSFWRNGVNLGTFNARKLFRR